MSLLVFTITHLRSAQLSCLLHLWCSKMKCMLAPRKLHCALWWINYATFITKLKGVSHISSVLFKNIFYRLYQQIANTG